MKAKYFDNSQTMVHLLGTDVRCRHSAKGPKVPENVGRFYAMQGPYLSSVLRLVSKFKLHRQFKCFAVRGITFANGLFTAERCASHTLSDGHNDLQVLTCLINTGRGDWIRSGKDVVYTQVAILSGR